MATGPSRRFAPLFSLVATLLTGALAFQLAVAGSGVLCMTPHRDGMQAMQAMQSGSHVATEAGQEHAGRQNSPDQPCDGHTQTVQCAAMATCAPSVLLASSAVANTAPRSHATVVSAPVVAPLSKDLAPELPPPRA